MTYVKQTWANSAAGGTPINAARLSHIEDGVESANVGLTHIQLTTGSGAAAANTAAIVESALIAKTAGTTLKFPSGTFYINTGSIILECDVDGRGCILNTVGSTTAIQLGVASTSLFRKNIHLPELQRSTGLNWAETSSIGVDIVGGLSSCNITIPYCAWFTYNVNVGPVSAGTTLGVAYNVFYVGHLTEGLINWRVKPTGSGAFANDNLVIGGKWSHSGPPTHDHRVSGVREIQIGPLGVGATDFINAWVFLKPTLEGAVSEYQIECYGSDCEFHGARYEAPARTVQGSIAGGALTTFTIDPLTQVTRFTAFDIGVPISIPGAGPAGATLSTTIAARPSATVVTLAAAASGAVTQASATVFSYPQIHWGVSGAASTATNNIIQGGSESSNIVVTTDVNAIRNVVESPGRSSDSTIHARRLRGGNYGFEDGITVGRTPGSTYASPAPLALRDNGHIEFSSGTGASDAAIYRLGPDAIYIDAAITVDGPITSAFDFNIHRLTKTAASLMEFLLVAQSGDSQYRITVDTSGKILWGSGSAVGDTNLYRSAANILATDDDLECVTVGKGVILKSPDGTRYRLTVANGGALSAVAV